MTHYRAINEKEAFASVLEVSGLTMNGLEKIADVEYPGRFILVGALPDAEIENSIAKDLVVVYGMTGRSESSKARELHKTTRRVHVRVTDEKQLQTGNPALLVYDAIARIGDNLIVSNGAQTEYLRNFILDNRLIEISMDNENHRFPASILPAAFATPALSDGIDLAAFEPDKPNYTPRITALINHQGAAMHIVKRQHNGLRNQQTYNLELAPGQGKFISTYEGSNARDKDPLHSFMGEPFEVDLTKFSDLASLTEGVYKALGPKQGYGWVSPNTDFRISVAGVDYSTLTRDMLMGAYIINATERRA